MKKIFLVAPYKIDSRYKIKKDILKVLCDDFKIELTIAEDAITGNSLNSLETVKLIKECDFSIADISYERQSCYYEIGFLQALEKRLYLICEINTTVHQLLDIDKIEVYSTIGTYQTVIKNILIKETII